MKKLVGLITFYLLISLFTVDVSAEESIKLTVPLPLTGAQATFGEIEKRSYEIAMEEINAARGIIEEMYSPKYSHPSQHL